MRGGLRRRRRRRGGRGGRLCRLLVWGGWVLRYGRLRRGVGRSCGGWRGESWVRGFGIHSPVLDDFTRQQCL